MPYTATAPVPAPTAEELRSRVPGWGADLDPADRPAFPRERTDLDSGAHWVLPEQQEERAPRERSIEHTRLTPVFGTAQPMKGLSGVIKKLAYRRFSEGKATHWLLLVASDRVDAIESHLASLATLRPDQPITQSGIRGELSHHGWRSRVGRSRVDLKHAWLDPLIVVGPWLVVGALAVSATSKALSGTRGSR
jgi:hypothetical protein